MSRCLTTSGPFTCDRVGEHAECETQAPEYVPVGSLRLAPSRRARIKIAPTPNAPSEEKPRVIDGIVYGSKP